MGDMNFPDPSQSPHESWEWDGVKWAKIMKTGKSEITAIASGVMTTGEMVVLNDDGTVSVVAETYTPPGPGAPEVFNSADLTFISSTYDPANDKVVISYRDKGNSDYGTAVVGAVSGSSITFGTPVVFEFSGSIGYISSAYDSANKKVVISYSDGNNSNYGTTVVGTVSGDSITFGTPVVFKSSNATEISSTYNPVNSKVVISYADNNNSSYGTAAVGTVSGDSISFGTPVEFYRGRTGATSTTYDPVNNKVVIFYADADNSGYGTAVVGTVSGDSITFGTPELFNSAGLANLLSTYDPANSKVVIIYRDQANSAQGTAVVGTVSGDSISFGSPKVFYSGVLNSPSITYDSANNKVVISYQDFDTKNGTVIAGTVSGDSISFDAPEVFNSGSVATTSITYDSANNKVVISYRDNVNSNYGTAVTYSFSEGVSTNLTDSNYIGVSTGDYADGSEATVQIAGINADQQGMTIGKQYILPDGSLTTDAGYSKEYEVGAPEVFNNNISTEISATYDPVNNKVIIAYVDNVNSRYPTVVVGTVSGDSISFGTPVVFNSADSQYVTSAYHERAGKTVFVFTERKDGGKAYAIVGTTTGNSVSFFGSKEQLGSVDGYWPLGASYICAVYDPVSERVIVAFQNNFASPVNGSAVVGTVNGDSISFGPLSTFYDDLSYNCQIAYDTASERFVIVFQSRNDNYYGKAVVGEVAGPSITFGSPVVFSKGIASFKRIAYNPVANKMVVAYRDAGISSDNSVAIAGTVSGNSISFGSAELISSVTSQPEHILYDPVTEDIIIFTQNIDQPKKGQVVVTSVSGDAISFGDPQEFTALSTSHVSATCEPASGKVIVAFNGNDGVSSVGTALTLEYTGSIPTNVFAGTAISSTELNIKDIA